MRPVSWREACRRVAGSSGQNAWIPSAHAFNASSPEARFASSLGLRRRPHHIAPQRRVALRLPRAHGPPTTSHPLADHGEMDTTRATLQRLTKHDDAVRASLTPVFASLRSYIVNLTAMTATRPASSASSRERRRSACSRARWRPSRKNAPRRPLITLTPQSSAA